MKPLLHKIYGISLRYGFDPKQFLSTVKTNNRWFNSDLREFKRQQGTDNTFKFGSLYPIFKDRNEEGGTMKGHYFHQDLYVARLIHQAKPTKHLDVGSRTDGFVAHVASFRNIELIDIRNINSNVKNIAFRQADLTNLPADLINYCDSISSLHTIEHFGLGRYGDPIDYLGYLKGIENLTKILVQGGTFYFSVPIGPQRIEFNAHRVFTLKYLLDILTPKYDVKSFSYVDDSGDFHEDMELTQESIESDFACWFGCGIFTLIKK